MSPLNSQVVPAPARARPVRHAAEAEVMARLEDNPRTSSRLVAAQVGCSHQSVLRIAHDHRLRPWKLTKVQHLRPDDPSRRLDFCRWLLAREQEHPNFRASILVSDEKGFSREGTFNAHNNHYWTEDNPHQMMERGYQQKFSANVWAEIVGDNLLGPYILPLPARLTGENYLVFLREVLPELLEEIPVALEQRHWLQHDGCPAHNYRDVRAHLDQRYPGRWIGRGGPVLWPPRSPDLTPLDFILWGAMEAHVYETPVETVEDLVARIVLAGEAVRGDPGVCERVRQAWLHRCQKCIEQNGGQIEHVL